MENKINIAELLKDCPKGMELYSPMFGIVYFQEVRNTGLAELIIVTTSCNSTYEFYNDGKFNTHYSDSEMLLFPSKDQRDWREFQRPFKDGDIVTFNDEESLLVACIYKDRINTTSFYHHIALYEGSLGILINGEIVLTNNELRFATEEEKQKLFNAIKENGYRWNAETKTLENLVEPIFKVGDKIEKCGYRFTIAEVKDDYYLTKCGNKIPIDNQDDFSLVPNKFDITTLKPFDKVLVRDSDKDMWRASIFSNTWKDRYFCVGAWHNQCIPYDVNKELLGTTNDCDEYYKTW